MSRRSKAALEVALSLSLEDCGFKSTGRRAECDLGVARAPAATAREQVARHAAHTYLTKIKEPALSSVISAACHPTPQFLRCALTAASP